MFKQTVTSATAHSEEVHVSVAARTRTQGEHSYMVEIYEKFAVQLSVHGTRSPIQIAYPLEPMNCEIISIHPQMKVFIFNSSTSKHHVYN